MLNIKIKLFDGLYSENFGNALHFNYITDAKEFKIYEKIKFETRGNFPQIGVGARKGLVLLYKPLKSKNWYNLDTLIGKSVYSINMKNLIEENEKYEVVVYCPLLCKLDYLTLELPDNCFFKKKTNSEKKILVVGGINTFGNGCTKTSLMYPNILSRKLDSELALMSTNKINYLEEIHDSLKKTKSNEYYDIGIIELDYVGQSDEMVDKYLEKIINNLDKKCKFIIGWYSLPNFKQGKNQKISQITEKYKNSDHILIENLSQIHNEYKDVCTLNDFYLNDSGNIFIYKKLIETIGSVTKWNI